MLEEDSSYDLILVDEHMPMMNGIEFTRKAIECYEKQLVSPPVIVMCTADYSTSLGHKSIEAGAQGKQC
jgi:CheY-like chemotaxis protein